MGQDEATNDPDAPVWIKVDESGPYEVFEFVPTNDPTASTFRDEFRSDKDREKPPRGREERYPELHDAISAFRSLDLARIRWKQIADRVGAENVRLGPWIARVRLEPGSGFEYELSHDPAGHLYVRGETDRLVDAVIDVIHVEDVPESE